MAEAPLPKTLLLRLLLLLLHMPLLLLFQGTFNVVIQPTHFSVKLIVLLRELFIRRSLDLILRVC